MAWRRGLWSAALLVAACTDSTGDPKWHAIVNSTSAFPAMPRDVRFDADGNLLLVTDGGILYRYRDDVLALFDPAPPANVGTPWRADNGTLWVKDTVGGLDYRLVANGTAWEPVPGDSAATAMTPIREASGGTLFAICSYPPEPDSLEAADVRYCTRDRAGTWIRGLRTEWPQFPDELPAFDDHRGGIVYDGIAYGAFVMDTQLFGVTREGNFLYGDANYQSVPLQDLMLEVRPDGMGRSWVDHGCVRGNWTGEECADDHWNLVYSPRLPVLSPSGAAYQIWQMQNGDLGGALIRARPNFTKWEVIGNGNPFGAQLPTLYISPVTGKLYQLAFDSTEITDPNGGGVLVINVALFEMDEPELP